jgi:hypothetical protein
MGVIPQVWRSQVAGEVATLASTDPSRPGKFPQHQGLLTHRPACHLKLKLQCVR